MKSPLVVLAVCLLLTLVALPVWAQLSPSQAKAHRARIENSRRLGKTVWSYDTIYHKGEAYGILRSVGGANRDFSVFALNNPQELILVQNLMRVRQGSLEVLFRFLDEAGGQGVVRSSIDVRDFVCQVLVDEKLLTPTGLNRPAVNHFLRKYGIEEASPARLTDEEDESEGHNLYRAGEVQAGTQPPPAGGTASPPRDRGAFILHRGEDLMQDNVLIGRVKMETNFDLPHLQQYLFYDPQGQPVATMHEDESHDLVLVTARDGRQHRLTQGSSDYDRSDLPVIGAAKFLIRFFYL